MNAKQIHRFVQHYLESTDCRIIEKSPAHFKVKLSPLADRILTNRPYYWGFVDRTGAEPETMSFLFVTDKEKYDQSVEEQTAKDGPDQTDAALARSFGYVHATTAGARMPREDLYYGSKRLEQLFEAARSGGSYVCLFQEPDTKKSHPMESTAYTPWLGLNMRVEFQCDRKREEIHSFGVSLATGQCVEQFQDRLSGLRMTPRLPPNVHIARSSVTLHKAAGMIEQTLEKKLRTYDYGWAEEAAQRLEEEQQLIAHYYDAMLASAEEEAKTHIQTQFENRKAEIDWQYKPRVLASAINCGIFHLAGID
ncbi:YqhG family protein [Paenibacillus daejeonensis]|uniref:YqhG family protein n=1 Tax=Paenibacillus daejeonensis TaxID=135193 RepID=UPI000368C66A|nr:YqhG family protein [Paenibacillus daejeonensis]